MKGHVKVFEIIDGKEKLILSEDNILTYGYRSQITNILLGEGSNDLNNFSLSYFRLGMSGLPFESQPNSSVFFSLSTPMGTAHYGYDSDFELAQYCWLVGTSGAGVEVMFAEPASGLDIGISKITGVFCSIDAKNKTKRYMESFNIRIKLDKDTCNGTSIAEAGLYFKNPLGLPKVTPMLAAYKKFDPPINKTSENQFIIDWSIGNLNTTNKVDTYFIDTLIEDSVAEVPQITAPIVNELPQVTPSPYQPGGGPGEIVYGLIPGAIENPIGNYSGPIAGGTIPSWLSVGAWWFWVGSNSLVGLYVGLVRFGWQYAGNGYWRYIGYSGMGPYQGPAGGGSFNI